jgi:hypothetical protein
VSALHHEVLADVQRYGPTTTRDVFARTRRVSFRGTACILAELRRAGLLASRPHTGARRGHLWSVP